MKLVPACIKISLHWLVTSAIFQKMSKGEPVMADILAPLSPPKKLKFDNVKSVAANIFDSTSQIASDTNNERTSSVLSNEYSKASPVKKKKKRKVLIC